jgi:hypothetical protein
MVMEVLGNARIQNHRIEQRDLETIDQTSPMLWRKIRAFFKSVRVTVHYTGSSQMTRARPIKDFVPRAGLVTFDHDGVQMTVQVRRCPCMPEIGTDIHPGVF